jgi:hypothetical protein
MGRNRGELEMKRNREKYRRERKRSSEAYPKRMGRERKRR